MGVKIKKLPSKKLNKNCGKKWGKKKLGKKQKIQKVEKKKVGMKHPHDPCYARLYEVTLGSCL